MWRGRSAYNVLNLIPHGEFMLGADSALFITLMSETPYLGMALTRQARRKQVKSGEAISGSLVPRLSPLGTCMTFDRTKIEIKPGNEATLAAYSNMVVYNVHAKHTLTRGMSPQKNFQLF